MCRRTWHHCRLSVRVPIPVSFVSLQQSTRVKCVCVELLLRLPHDQPAIPIHRLCLFVPPRCQSILAGNRHSPRHFFHALAHDLLNPAGFRCVVAVHRQLDQYLVVDERNDTVAMLDELPDRDLCAIRSKALEWRVPLWVKPTRPRTRPVSVTTGDQKSRLRSWSLPCRFSSSAFSSGSVHSAANAVQTRLIQNGLYGSPVVLVVLPATILRTLISMPAI